MHVDTILQSKGSAVHTLPDTATLADAVMALNSHNIGALVIIRSNGAIAGMLSERDIIRRLGNDSVRALTMNVQDCMTRSVFTCTRDTEIADVMARMTSLRIRHIPVTEGAQLVGIISIGDVVKRKIEEAEHEAEALKEYIAS